MRASISHVAPSILSASVARLAVAVWLSCCTPATQTSRLRRESRTAVSGDAQLAEPSPRTSFSTRPLRHRRQASVLAVVSDEFDGNKTAAEQPLEYWKYRWASSRTSMPASPAAATASAVVALQGAASSVFPAHTDGHLRNLQLSSRKPSQKGEMPES